MKKAFKKLMMFALASMIALSTTNIIHAEEEEETPKTLGEVVQAFIDNYNSLATTFSSQFGIAAATPVSYVRTNNGVSEVQLTGAWYEYDPTTATQENDPDTGDLLYTKYVAKYGDLNENGEVDPEETFEFYWDENGVHVLTEDGEDVYEDILPLVTKTAKASLDSYKECAETLNTVATAYSLDEQYLASVRASLGVETNEEIEAAMITLAESIAELQKSNEELTKTNTELTKTNTELSKTNEELSKTNEELTKLNNEILEANKTLKTDNSGLVSTNASLAATNQNLSNQNASLTSTNASLTATNASLTSTNTNLTNTNSTLTTANNSLTTTNGSLSSLANSTTNSLITKATEDPAVGKAYVVLDPSTLGLTGGDSNKTNTEKETKPEETTTALENAFENTKETEAPSTESPTQSLTTAAPSTEAPSTSAPEETTVFNNLPETVEQPQSDNTILIVTGIIFAAVLIGFVIALIAFQVNKDKNKE